MIKKGVTRFLLGVLGAELWPYKVESKREKVSENKNRFS